MAGKRQKHTAAFKAQVALAALKGDKTVNELAAQFSVHPTLIHSYSLFHMTLHPFFNNNLQDS